MNELISRILELPRQQKIGVLAGLILLILGMYYLFFYAPRSARISELSEGIENTRNERVKKKKLLTNLPKLQRQLRELDGRLKEAVAQLPDRKEIPDLLSSISARARDAGLDILIFRPRAEDVRDFYAEIPVDIVVRGGFHEVVTFFDEVGSLNRLVNIKNIEIKNPRPQGGQISLETSALATTFRFLDEAERKKIAAAKAAAAKKRR